MTQDEIIEMGVKAELCDEYGTINFEYGYRDEIIAFAKLVAAKERKTILLNTMKARNVDGNCDIVLCAEIRTRGEA
jgi:hypothetical protein